jgi:hypothetical protein
VGEAGVVAVRVALGVGVAVGVGAAELDEADADGDGRGTGRRVRWAAGARGAVTVLMYAGDPAQAPPDPERQAPVVCRAVTAPEAPGEVV